MAYSSGVPGDDDDTNHRVSSHGGHRARGFCVIDDGPVAGACAVPHASALLYFKKPTSRRTASNESGDGIPVVQRIDSRGCAVASSSSSSSSYADGYHENPMAGSPVTAFVAYKDSIAAAGPLQVHTGGEEHSLLLQSSRPMSRGDTHKIVVGREDVPDHIIHHAPSTPSVGNPSIQTFKTHSDLRDCRDREGSHRTALSFEEILARTIPQSTGAPQPGKSYIPIFLRAGVKVKNGPATESLGLPSPVANQGQAVIPACLTPGWGESRRAPPVVGKSGAAIGRVVVGRHHHDEMHLGESTAKANLPDESVPKKSKGLAGVRRALERPWKKRNVQNEAPTESTLSVAKARILLAQSGPASIVTKGVFSPEVVVTSPSRNPCQAKVRVSDLPCTLRPGYASHAMGEEKNGDSPNYKWPFVDLTNELFLNFDPKKDQGHGGRARGLKHQEPRIVGEDFFGHDLQDEVLRDLASRERRERTSNSRPISQAGLEVKLDAASSITPYSALAVAKEMAIMGGGVTTLTVNEIHTGPPNQASPSQPVTQSASETVLAVPTPKQDEEIKKTDQADFSWFRFGRVDLEDPAEEHCRSYRNRRREMRRSKQESWFESGTQEDEIDGSNGSLPVRDPEKSWLVL